MDARDCSGVLGCEYATIFAALGTKVTVVDRRERVLRFLDGDILDTLCHSMRGSGIRLMQSEKISGVRIETQKRDAEGVVYLDDNDYKTTFEPPKT